MTVFRFKVSDTNPAHTRVRLFAGPDVEHLAMAGELCFRNEEFEAFANAITEYNERVEGIWHQPPITGDRRDGRAQCRKSGCRPYMGAGVWVHTQRCDEAEAETS